MAVTRIWDADAAQWIVIGGQGLPGTGIEEVDGSVEIDGLIGLFDTLTVTSATLNLAIPAGWTSWKCYANATMSANNAAGNPATLDLVIYIDGTAGLLHQTKLAPLNALDGRTVQARRTGITTTGSRVVALWAKRATSDNIALNDVMLYARAVRTS